MRNLTDSKNILKDTAILLVAYSRPNLLKNRINEISKCDIENVHISIDGGIKSHTSNMDEAKDYAKKILSKKKLYIYHHQNNLGLAKHITEQISKILLIHRYIILVEDDIKLSPSIFRNIVNGIYELQKINKLGTVSGVSNLYSTRLRNKWRFSLTAGTQGLILTREVWYGYRLDLSNVNIGAELKLSRSWQSMNRFQRKYWMSRFKGVQKNPTHTWDHQLTYHSLINNFVNLKPVFALIGNEGWGENATHTKGLKPKSTKNHMLNGKDIKLFSNFDKLYGFFDQDNIYSYFKMKARSLLEVKKHSREYP